MKVKKSLFINILILTLIAFTSFISCEVQWFKNFNDSVVSASSLNFHFYSKDPKTIVPGDDYNTTVRKYRIGKEVTSSELPDYNDPEIASWKTDARVGRWLFSQTSDGSEDLSMWGNFISFTPIDHDIDLYAEWHYKYGIDVQVEDVTGGTYTSEGISYYYDIDGKVFTPLLPERPGFTQTSTPVTVSSSSVNNGEVKFTRKVITVTFDADGGTFEGVNPTSDKIGKYGTTLTAPVPVRAGYNFIGWNAEVPDTFPANDVTYTALWEDNEFTLTYADWNAGWPDSKSCSAEIASIVNPLPAIYTLGVETELPDPISTAIVEDTIEFAGYYYDADCTKSLSKNASGKYYLKSTDTGNKIIYLKWKYKNVYVDPVNGNDRNTGHNVTNALKTVAEAKKYLACGQDECAIVLQNALTDADDISKLSGISTASYNNARLTNESTYYGSLVNLSDNVTLENLVIDSGSMASVISVSDGLLTVKNITFNMDLSFTGVNVSGTGGLLISGDFNYIPKRSNSASPASIATGSSGKLYISGAGKINSPNAVILQSGQSIDISEALTQSGIIAKIKSAVSAASPVVITDSVGGSYVSTYYKQFESADTGYSINSLGQLVEASGIGLYPVTPTITEYDPGNLATTVITKVSGGDTFVTFDVKDAAYEKIAVWGTDKYIQYTIDGKYGNVVITGSAGSYKAVLNLTSLTSGTDPSVTHNDLRYGFLSLVIYAEPENPVTDVITAKEYQIFVK